MTAGPLAAIDSTNRRQAENDSSRDADWPESIPNRGSSLALTQSRSSTSRSTCSSFAAAASGESDSNTPACDLTISPSAQNVIPSPYGRQRPCRQRISSVSLVDVPEQLCAQPALADPWLSHERHELERRVPRAPVEQPL